MSTFLRLSMSQKLLLFEVTIFHFMAWILVYFVPFKFWSKFLGEKHIETSPLPLHNDVKFLHFLALMVKLVSKRVPWKSTCLVEAVAAKFALSRRRIPSTLYLGLAKSNNENRTALLQAHAWLKSGEMILTGGENANDFTVVMSFGRST